MRVVVISPLSDLVGTFMAGQYQVKATSKV